MKLPTGQDPPFEPGANPPAAHVSLEQLEAFVAVTEQGTFTGAARTLGKAQSAISQAVRALEQETGLVLFDRSRYRPRPTPAGDALLADARAALAGRERFRRHATRLASGEPAHLQVVVLALLPLDPFLDALGPFDRTFPEVTLHLEILGRGDTWTRLENPSRPLVAFTHLEGAPARPLATRPLGSLRMIAVAAPAHPLGEAPGPLDAETVGRHRQIVLSDLHDVSLPDQAVYAAETWRASTLGAKHALIRAGLGWGFMPEPWVRADLGAGRLRPLRCEIWGDHVAVPIHAAWTLPPLACGEAGEHLVEACTQRWGGVLA